MSRIIVPPIKSQGIKTKLIPLIDTLLPKDGGFGWVEPFMGTGCVGFNLSDESARMCDSNPHLIRFYQAIASREITAERVRAHLTEEGEKLRTLGESHYYATRNRFNETRDPMDFLFLNRSCFNGMIRFNRRGGFNVPFCRKPNRFAPAYVTRISRQVQEISQIIHAGEFTFSVRHFTETIRSAQIGDIIYCDPPYIDRHVDYFNGWTEADEHALYAELSKTPASFVLSTWSHNAYRKNEYLSTLWSDFPHITRDHFYHVGGSIENRRGVTEAVVHSPDLHPHTY